ncbi:helix-turn-helix domain-containing protein [Sulfitobacter sp. EhC04]|jgi:transcriptional regulator with XRE-family HTH domain|uniref:helix-turn-helix domain-containing protein n=1 Tax=Sulfitobacter sp. EhC04 TaxID=1849168 RepID=UPI0026A71B84
MAFTQIKMTPAEFREARLAFGLSRKELSRELNVSFDAIKKWEDDNGYGPHPTAIIAMIWFREGFRPKGSVLPKVDAEAGGR